MGKGRRLRAERQRREIEGPFYITITDSCEHDDGYCDICTCWCGDTSCEIDCEIAERMMTDA